MRYVVKNPIRDLIGDRNSLLRLKQSCVFALLAVVVLGCNSGSDTATFNAPAAVVPPPVVGQRAPTISGTPPATAPANMMYTFTPTASDADGDALTFQINNAANLPTGVTFTASNGRLTGTPAVAQVGMTFSNIVISVSDGVRITSLPAFAVTVTAAPNRAPTITGVPRTSVQSGVQYTFQAVGADLDVGSTLVYSIQNAPVWADTTLFATTGRLVGTPGTQHVGTTFSRITISVSDGVLTASLPAFSILVTAVGNNAPTISGAPAATAVVGQAYVPFTPTAADPDGNALTFSIANRPAWASFDAANGRLSGTPPDGSAGIYPGIVISVSDGQVMASLPVFTITVNQIGTGTATLSWTAPTMNTDNTPLTDLAGYRIYYATSASALSQGTIVDLGSSVISHPITNLNSGTYYFAVTARNLVGVESDLSNVVSKTIQ